MTITITPETEEKLRRRAAEEGVDLDTLANSLLAAALLWEAEDRADAVAGIRRGLDAGVAGRVRPAEQVFADLRAKLPIAP